MGLRNLLAGKGRGKGAQGLHDQAKRAFESGNNAAGLAALRKLADGGDPDVLFEIGECYETGKGALINFATAATWYEKAAQKAIWLLRTGSATFICSAVERTPVLPKVVKTMEPVQAACGRKVSRSGRISPRRFIGMGSRPRLAPLRRRGDWGINMP